MLSFFFAGTLGTPAQNLAGIAAIFSLVSEKSILNGGLDTTKSNLVRAFAVTSGFIQFWYTNEYEGHIRKLLNLDFDFVLEKK